MQRGRKERVAIGRGGRGRGLIEDEGELGRGLVLVNILSKFELPNLNARDMKMFQ